MQPHPSPPSKAWLILAALALALALSGCGPEYDHGGIVTGMSPEEVKAVHADLRPGDEVIRKRPSSIPKKESNLQLWRFPSDANGAVFESYGFKEGKLSSIMIGYSADADFDLVANEIKARNGSPNDLASLGGAQVMVWESSGKELALMGFPQSSPLTYLDSNGKEVTVTASSMLVFTDKHSQGPLLLGVALMLLLLAVLAVASIRLELGRLKQQHPRLQTLADLNAYRRVGYRHKLLDVLASGLLIGAGLAAGAGLLRDEFGILDIVLVLGSFSVYTALGKSYQKLGRSLSSLTVADEALRADWQAWLKVMNTPLALGDAKRHSDAAG